MRKLLYTLAFLTLLTPSFAFAQFTTHQGGDGLVDVSVGSILFGSVANIRMASSSALQFSNAFSRLTFTNGSSTAFTGTNIFSTNASSTNLTISGLGATANCLQVNSVGVVSTTACSAAVNFPFTPNAASVFWNQVSNSTTTQVHFGATGVSLSASSTSQFANSSTTLASINTLYLNGSNAITSTSTLFAAGTAGNVLTYTTAGTWIPSATSTFSGTAPISATLNGNNAVVVACTTAASGVAGCFDSTSWANFNNKISSTSLSGASVISYTSSSGIITTTPGTFVGTAGSVYAFPGALNIPTTTQMVLGINANGTIVATSTPTAGGFYATSTTQASIFILASTTKITASGETGIPNAASSPTLPSGDIAIDTTAASSSLRYGDGAATHSLYAVRTGSIIVSSSTLAYLGAFGAAGTTTFPVMNNLRPITLKSAYCLTDVGTAHVDFGPSGTHSNDVTCSTTPTLTTLSSNNVLTMLQALYVSVGRNASAPNTVTISLNYETAAD